MTEKPERIELEVQPGSVTVQRGRCPRGCDLMDAAFPIHGYPSVRVAYRFSGGEGQVNLDPVYGRFENIGDREVPDGTVLEFACSRCGASLVVPHEACMVCSAPMFMIHLPRGGYVEACQRKGCFQHRLRLVTDEEAMQRLFDRLAKDSFL